MSALRTTKLKFFATLSKSLSCLKDFWKLFRVVSKDTQVPATLSLGNKSATNPTDKACLLNSHFASCFTPRTSSPLPADIDKVAEDEELSTIQCSHEDVFHVLLKMRSNTASGPDDISSTMLKKCADSISLQLSVIFNLSFTSGCVPDDWKISRVTLIFKSKDRSCVENNYRPISLVAKVLERLVHDCLMQHVLMHDHLSSSTQEALLVSTRDWHDTLDRGGSVVCLFLDLAKAFDSVPHTLILHSLVRVGVRGALLCWFQSQPTCCTPWRLFCLS